MVYRGPSKGCQTCRRRRVKCDEARPQCGNCIKRKQQCPGYRDSFDAVHKDETLATSLKNSSKKSPGTDVVDETIASDSNYAGSTAQLSTPSPSQSDSLVMLVSPSRNVETECLTYFFANYVDIPRDPSTNIFIEHILPLYISAPLESALTHAANAVAINVAQMWMQRGIDSSLARESYAKAVSLVQYALQDPVQSRTDDTLAAVFLLDFYDSLNKRFVGFIDTGMHQQGAMALLRHRGKENFESATSRRLFTALRSRHINFSLQAGKKVQLDGDLLAEETALLPSAKLDLINAELADLHVTVPDGPEAMGVGLVEFYQTIMQQALVIDEKLQAWRDSLPESWRPVAIPASQLHPTIRAAGVYGDTVDVYTSLTVSHINNAARSSHVGALRLISLCRRELEALGVEADPDLGQYLHTQMQEIADRFCASIPYHLGNRTTLTFPHEHREYPHVPIELRRLANYVDPFGNPVEMTQEDHIRAAAAIGGWFIMTPLMGFLRAPFLRSRNAIPGPLVSTLRYGQLDWVRGQMQRLQRIYGLPANGTPEWKYPLRTIGTGAGHKEVLKETFWNRQLWQV
ncbi:hypothetical protein EDD37DRAFT_38556 [Exophiala viscosa]|uniref:uncharacterized protein n=1 Tax=Exophiala viscosa TaxID=2486360 RepID=UPI00219DB929|nr:hypothetical protein EDD37DRAFT_38556 [Exophiala viscosa]